MESRNFSFIPRMWEKLEHLATTAEGNIFNDPNLSLVTYRMFGETLTKEIITLKGLTLHNKQYKRLDFLKKNQFITNEVFEMLEVIRKKGNTAVHNPNYGDIKSALQLNRYSYDLIVWFLKKFDATSELYPEYIEPSLQKSSKVTFIKKYDSKEEALIAIELELLKESNQEQAQNILGNVNVNHKKKIINLPKYPRLDRNFKNQIEYKKVFPKVKMRILTLFFVFILTLFLVSNSANAYVTGKFISGLLDNFFLQNNVLKFKDYAYKKAIDQWDTDRIDQLLTLGVNPNILSEKGKHALILSIQKNNAELLDKLLNNGADPFLVDLTGTNVIEVAVEKGDLNIINSLLENHTVEKLKNETLKKILNNNHEDLLSIFLNKGLDPNLFLTDEEESILIYAIENNQNSIVDTLLQNGADPNLPSNSGKYPLHTSIQNNNIKIALMLLESGANPNLQDESEMYPIELANVNNLLDFESLLMDFNSKSLYEINLKEYIGYWKEKSDTPGRIIQIFKNNIGDWYLIVIARGNENEEIIKILPNSNQLIPISNSEIKILDQHFIKITVDEFNKEKKLLSDNNQISFKDSSKISNSNSESSSTNIDSSNAESKTNDFNSDNSSVKIDDSNSSSTTPTEINKEPSKLSKKMDNIIGVWKRITPLENNTHDIRYLFIEKNYNEFYDYHYWTFHYESEWGHNSKNFIETRLELSDNILSTIDKPALATYNSAGFYKTRTIKGFIITLNDDNNIMYEHVNHNETKIVIDQFIRIPNNKIEVALEEEYQERYNMWYNNKNW